MSNPETVVREEQTTKPAKMALIIDRPEDMSTFSMSDLLNSVPRLEDRAIVDRQLEEGEVEPTLQLLPYFMLIDDSVENKEDYKVLCYKRGAGGGESRLFDKISVGFGGHMEEGPGPDFEPVITLAHLIAKGMVLEAEEEIELVLPYTYLLNAMIPNHYFEDENLTPILAAKNATLMYEPVTQVDSVHLGIGFVLRVTPEMIGVLEKGIIEDTYWTTWSELFARDNIGEIELETWSKILLSRYEKARLRNPKAPMFDDAKPASATVAE